MVALATFGYFRFVFHADLELYRKILGLRSLEKTAADLYKFGSSRDFGVALKGAFDENKRLNYHFMFGNGASTGSENNDGKKVALSLGYIFPAGFSLEVYGDWEKRPGDTNRLTVQGFLGYQNETFRTGGHVMHQTRERTGENEERQLASVFGAAKLSEKVWGFVRWDRSFDPLSGDEEIFYIPFGFNFLLVGVDYTPIKNVHFMPNFELVFYDEVNGSNPDSDVTPRFTFYYIWK